MSFDRRTTALIVALALACAPAAFGQQAPTGTIGGRAGRQYGPYYLDYRVQLRSLASGKPVVSGQLDRDGQFSFPSLDLSQKYLVELLKTGQTAPVCTEGPYQLGGGKSPDKTDVVIECGKPPALVWLLVAGAGTISAVGLSTASASR